MNKALLASLSLVSIAFAGATLVAARTPSAVVAPAVASGTYKVDPVHSTVLFSTTHMNTSRSYGRFNTVAGTLLVDTAKPETSKVEIQIQVASIDTANSKRDEHLRGPDFFDVKQFPVASFESSKVEKTGDKSWKVTGMLSIHGVKKSMTVPFEQVGEGKGMDGEALIGFHAAFSIQRADFGIEYGKGVLGDTVDMIVSLEAAAPASK